MDFSSKNILFANPVYRLIFLTMKKNTGKSAESFRVVVVHGGPGGVGSAAGLARGLAGAGETGVLGPLQSKYSVMELRDELAEQIAGAGITAPVVLVGHSWGAWLAALFAEKYPEKTSRLILVGGGPLRPGFDVDSVRRSRFSPEEAVEFERLASRLAASAGDERDALLERLGAICEKTDTCCPAAAANERPSKCDGEMFVKVWGEASGMRQRGELERIFSRLRAPVTIIHGDHDPHPADGVSSVLAEYGIPFHYHLLERCGHTPWREKYARKAFFDILVREIRQ